VLALPCQDQLQIKPENNDTMMNNGLEPEHTKKVNGCIPTSSHLTEGLLSTIVVFIISASLSSSFPPALCTGFEPTLLFF
jgi:hypothetical protein